MSWADTIAFSALVIGLIAGAGIWFSAYERRLTNRERELELRTQMSKSGAEQGTGELAKLEHRLRVLERIATDKSTMLATQIEDLRESADVR
ncbi:MAG: hypothetical protein KA233_10510 [Novosphingobium sp.]|jgi:hypothetical protein|nr:hypothetical protein [Novosphingobium sp.]MBP6556098.1 hypothetical protein [Novosphingobium sp.]